MANVEVIGVLKGRTKTSMDILVEMLESALNSECASNSIKPSNYIYSQLIDPTLVDQGDVTFVFFQRDKERLWGDYNGKLRDPLNLRFEPNGYFTELHDGDEILAHKDSKVPDWLQELYGDGMCLFSQLQQGIRINFSTLMAKASACSACEIMNNV